MQVNWKGRVAIWGLGRRSSGDFQRIDVNSTSWSTSSPFSWPGGGGHLLWGTPPHPPSRASALQPFPGFRRSGILACGRPSLVRYYAHTEQVPLNLNTYPGARANSRSPGDGRGNRSPSHWRQAPTCDRCPNYRLPTGQLDPSGRRRWNQQSRNIRLASARALNVSEFRRHKQLGFADHYWSTPQMWVDGAD